MSSEIRITAYIDVARMPEGTFDENYEGGVTSEGFEWLSFGLHQDRFGPVPTFVRPSHRLEVQWMPRAIQPPRKPRGEGGGQRSAIVSTTGSAPDKIPKLRRTLRPRSASPPDPPRRTAPHRQCPDDCAPPAAPASPHRRTAGQTAPLTTAPSPPPDEPPAPPAQPLPAPWRQSITTARFRRWCGATSCAPDPASSQRDRAATSMPRGTRPRPPPADARG